MPTLAECVVGLARSSRGKPGLRGGGTIPRIEAYATVSPCPRRLAAFRDLCRIAPGHALPLTWPYALVTPLHIQVVSSREFPLSALGLVHLREVIIQTRPIADDVDLCFHCRVEGHREHRRGIEFDLITEVSLHPGAPVIWRSTTTALSLGAKSSGQRQGPSRATGRPKGERWRIPEATGRRYARISRNFDPIHLHALTSRWFGFRRPIVHGMWTVARSVAALGPAFATPPVRLEVRFRSPIFLPGEVLFCARGGAEKRCFTVYSAWGGRSHLEGELHRL